MDARGKILNFAYIVLVLFLSYYSYFYSPVSGIVEAQGYSTCESYSSCNDCINNGCKWCWVGSSGSCISTCSLCTPSPPLVCYSSSCPECSSDSDCGDKCEATVLYVNGRCVDGSCVYDEYECNSGAYCDKHSCGGTTYYCDGAGWVTSTTGDLDDCATCCKCEGYHWDSATSAWPLYGDPCPTGCAFCCGDDSVERWATGNGVCCDGSWYSGGECCSDSDCPSGQHCCSDHKCHECCDNDDCSSVTCSGNFAAYCDTYTHTCVCYEKCETNDQCADGYCCKYVVTKADADKICVEKGTIVDKDGKSYICDPPVFEEASNKFSSFDLIFSFNPFS